MPRIPGNVLSIAKYNLVQVVFDREALSPDEDVAVTNWHIREVIQGAPDIIDVTDEGRQNFLNDISQWWTGLQSHITTKISLKEARFYDVPNLAGEDMGDPVLVNPYNSPGTSAGNCLPPQVACSVTFKTSERKRWGRSYLPGVTLPGLDISGRFNQTLMTDVALAYQHLTNRSGTGAALIVFSPTHRDHRDVDTIQVDDIPDVIRRRRFSHPLVRHQIDASP